MAGENIHQVFIVNPITTNTGTDLIYIGQSPYAVGNDAAILYSDFSAQFTPAIANNTLLANISGVSQKPLANTMSNVLDSTISNVQGDILFRNATGWVALAPGTAGQFLQTGGAAANVVWASGAGFIWNDVAGTTQAAVANNGYIISNAAQTTVTIPATVAESATFGVQGKGAGGWILQANTGQIIHLGSSASSSAGSLTSTNQWDSVQIVCVTANTTFSVTSVIGNLTVA